MDSLFLTIGAGGQRFDLRGLLTCKRPLFHVRWLLMRSRARWWGAQTRGLGVPELSAGLHPLSFTAQRFQPFGYPPLFPCHTHGLHLEYPHQPLLRCWHCGHRYGGSGTRN